MIGLALLAITVVVIFIVVMCNLAPTTTYLYYPVEGSSVLTRTDGSYGTDAVATTMVTPVYSDSGLKNRVGTLTHAAINIVFDNPDAPPTYVMNEVHSNYINFTNGDQLTYSGTINYTGDTAGPPEGDAQFFSMTVQGGVGIYANYTNKKVQPGRFGDSTSIRFIRLA